jgi:hypothetical protein
LKRWFILFFLSMGLCYAEEIGAEDREILKQLEFFSNLDLLEDEVDLEDLDKMEMESAIKIESTEKR